MLRRFPCLRLPCAVLVLTGSLAACGGSRGADEPVFQRYEDIQLTKPLTEELQQLEKEASQEPCDRTLSQKKHEIVSELDKPRPQPSRGNSGSASHRISFHGSYLVDLPKTVPTTTDWTEFSYGWSELHEALVKNREKNSGEVWSLINYQARSLLLEDKRRIVGNRNYGIHRRNVGDLPKIASTVMNCWKDPLCNEPPLTGETLIAARTIPEYRLLLEQIHAAKSNGERRALIDEFRNRMSLDLSTFFYRHNPGLRILEDPEQKIVHLDLDSGEFGPEEQNLISTVVEEVWNAPQARLRLIWKKAGEAADLFRFWFDPEEEGERAYVIREQRSIHLFPGTRTRSIAHEIGHVLGFPDTYYTTWDPVECRYTQSTNPVDIMSDSQSGDVTESEWQALLWQPAPER